MADFNIAKDLGARANQNAMPDLRVAVAGFLACSSERNPLQDRHVVFDHCGLADYEPRRMIEEYALADPGRRIDVDREHGRRPTLQIEREVAPTRLEHGMRQTMRLQRMEALEIEQHLHQAQAGRIAVEHGHDIRPERSAERGIAFDRVLIGLPDQRARHVAMIKTLSDTMHDRLLERVVIENGCHQKRGQRGIAPRSLFCFPANAREDRVIASYPNNTGGRTVRHHCLRNAIWNSPYHGKAARAIQEPNQQRFPFSLQTLRPQPAPRTVLRNSGPIEASLKKLDPTGPGRLSLTSPDPQLTPKIP